MSQELINSTEMREDVTKRTACMKVFEHADHSFTSAIYGTPVHYMKDGRWEEIDNRLEAAEDEPMRMRLKVKKALPCSLQTVGMKAQV